VSQVVKFSAVTTCTQVSAAGDNPDDKRHSPGVCVRGGKREPVLSKKNRIVSMVMSTIESLKQGILHISFQICLTTCRQTSSSLLCGADPAEAKTAAKKGKTTTAKKGLAVVILSGTSDNEGRAADKVQPQRVEPNELVVLSDSNS